MANRDVQHRVSDIVLEDDRLIKVGGQRQSPPTSPGPGGMAESHAEEVQEAGPADRPAYHHHVGVVHSVLEEDDWFSDDKTLRAENTRINWDKDKTISVNQFAKQWLHFDFVQEKWIQRAENKGKLSFQNWQAYAAIGAFAAMIAATGSKSDSVAGRIDVPPGTLYATGLGASTVEGFIIIPPSVSPPAGLFTVPAPRGSILEAAMLGVWALMAMTIGTGTYEIWGTPYDWVHARNVSEAFDSSQPPWVDNVADIESDFVVNEDHAKGIAIRELVYRAREANKWSVTLVDDPRIEYGDILQFTDGSKLYVEDFSRRLDRGSEAILDVKGFLIPLNKMRSEGAIRPPLEVPPPGTGTSEPPPGSGGGGTGGSGGEEGESTIPDYGSIVNMVEGWFNTTVPASENERGKAQMTRVIAWEIYKVNPNIGLLVKTGGNNVNGLSTDVVVQKPDGSFADVASHTDPSGGMVTITASWNDHPPDSNTSDMSRWVQPTEALANAPGPMTRKI